MSSKYLPKLPMSSFALVALLSLSACGDKKEVGPHADKPAPQNTKPTDAKDDGKLHDKSLKSSDGPTNPSDGSNSIPMPPPPGSDSGPSLPPPTAPTEPPVEMPTLPPPVATTPPRVSKPAPAPRPTETQRPPAEPKRQSPPVTKDPSIPIPAPVQNHSGRDPSIPIPAPSQRQQPRPPVVGSDAVSGYNAKDPANVENGRYAKRYTGFGEGELLYTGAGLDNILGSLVQRSPQNAAAQSILSARISRSNGRISLSLEVSEQGGTKAYVLNAIPQGGNAAYLRTVQTNGAKSIDGILKCMDYDGNCENSVAKLIIADGSGRAEVKIVLRDSLANVYAALTPNSSGSPEYATMRNFWLNSQNQAATSAKLKDAIFNSFEVVNGRSGFDVQIIGENRQIMIFAGPLLAPENGSAVNIRADRSADILGLEHYDYDMANTIGQAFIVNNNGLGMVKLSLKMRSGGGYPQNAFSLTIMRLRKPVLPLNEAP